MGKSLIIYFSRADEKYAVGYIDQGNTESVADLVQELTGAAGSLRKRLYDLH